MRAGNRQTSNPGIQPAPAAVPEIAFRLPEHGLTAGGRCRSSRMDGMKSEFDDHSGLSHPDGNPPGQHIVRLPHGRVAHSTGHQSTRKTSDPLALQRRQTLGLIIRWGGHGSSPRPPSSCHRFDARQAVHRPRDGRGGGAEADGDRRAHDVG